MPHTLLCLILLFGWAAFAQQRPLRTEDPTILEAGLTQVEFGFDFLRDAKYPVAGLRGNQTSLGVMGLQVSLAGVAEIQLDWTAHNLFAVTEAVPAPIRPHLSQGRTRTSDYGDSFFLTKTRLLEEADKLPAIGMFTSVQIPNASTAKGLGLNATQYRGGILVGKHFGRLHAFGNVGLGLLANPVRAGVQNDVMLYGVAGIWSVTERVHLAGEVFGHWSRRQRPPVGTESRSEIRLGLQIHAFGVRWDVGGVAGLAQHSPRSGVVIGLTRRFDSPLAD